MLFPSTEDTIVAVSSAWSASAVGIVRLSGPAADSLLSAITPADVSSAPPPPWRVCDTRIRIDAGLEVPATAYRFAAPRSYTGQDVVEIHTIGSPPLLRALCAALIAAGARRALPGEFTARAFLFGRIDESEMEQVLSLLRGGEEQAERLRGRTETEGVTARLRAVLERIERLAAEIEAGIDFSDEEDVRFATPAGVAAALDDLLDGVQRLRTALGSGASSAIPRVALAGLPNAGKSTLFNRLLGRERAIVSPLVGTTRDVLSAQVMLGGAEIVLQDTAGLGERQDELDLASCVMTERACGEADLVLWLHDGSSAWTEAESAALARIPASRRMIVSTKRDRAAAHAEAAQDHVRADVAVCALTGEGIPALAEWVAWRLFGCAGEEASPALMELESVEQALRAARRLAVVSSDCLQSPELIAAELRDAHARLSGPGGVSFVESVLGRIYSAFCIGK